VQVVQQPLVLQNFTGTVTAHALRFLEHGAAANAARRARGQPRQPWYLGSLVVLYTLIITYLT
jgi:hypothetical protein